MARHHRARLEHKHMQQQLAVAPECVVCGQRLGRHKFGSDQCPNVNWKPGSGQSQWLASTYREPGDVSAVLEAA